MLAALTARSAPAAKKTTTSTSRLRPQASGGSLPRLLCRLWIDWRERRVDTSYAVTYAQALTVGAWSGLCAGAASLPAVIS
jgi:hypothetical protein